MKTWLTSLIVVSAVLFGTSGAFAFHYDHRDSIRSAARDVDGSAQNLNAWAQRRAHHGDRAEAEGLRAVEKFAERASRFNRHVQDWRGRDRLERDYEKLQESFARLERKLDELHPDRRVQDEFNRSRDAMNRLTVLATRRGFDRRDNRRDSGHWTDFFRPREERRGYGQHEYGQDGYGR